jgi:hypothetical protein
MNQNFNASSEPFSVRRFEAKDHPAVLALWRTAEMRLRPVSDASDVLIEPSEGDLPANHLIWVAEASGRTVGSATVIHNNPSVAYLRSLCVAPDLASPPAVARALAETAIREVYERGYLKLVVHADLRSGRLTPVLHDLGFEFSREHLFDGEHVIEFYRNLYERPQLSLVHDGEQFEPLA